VAFYPATMFVRLWSLIGCADVHKAEIIGNI